MNGEENTNEENRRVASSNKTYSIPVSIMIAILAVAALATLGIYGLLNVVPPSGANDYVGIWTTVVECLDPDSTAHNDKGHDGYAEPHANAQGWYAIYPKGNDRYGVIVHSSFVDKTKLLFQNWQTFDLVYDANLQLQRNSGPFDCNQSNAFGADDMKGQVVLHNNATNVPEKHNITVWLHENSDKHNGQNAPVIHLEHTVIGESHRGVIH